MTLTRSRRCSPRSLHATFRRGLVCIAAVLLAAGCGKNESGPSNSNAPTGGEKPNGLLIVTLDTTRADRIGAYGYSGARTPNIDGLAERGVLFEQAMTSVPITAPAHASLLTGNYPPTHGVRTNENGLLSEQSVTLAEILREHGFRTGAFIGAAVLRRWTGLNQGFDTYWDEFPFESSPYVVTFAEKRAEQVVSAAEEWLAGVGDDPYFLWVHLFDPHGPYQPPGAFASEFKDSPYDGEIAYADEQIGVLLAAVERLGLRERTLLAFLSDHGEGLNEHLEDTHGMFLYNSTLHIPFILSCPSVMPQRMRVSDPVNIVDFAPTALAALDLGVELETHGRNLLPLVRGETSEIVDCYAETVYPLFAHGWTPFYALRRGDWKVINSPSPQLYDLRHDPGETSNLYAERRELADGLLKDLESLGRQMERESQPVAEVDPERLRALKSLGYVGGENPAEDLEGRPVSSDVRANTLKSLERVGDLLGKQRPQEALKLLDGLMRSEPRSRRVHELLGSALLAVRQFKQAEQAYKRLLEIAPHDGRANMNLGILAIMSGDAAVGRDYLEQARAELPNDPLVMLNLGLCYFQHLGQPELGRPLLERYLELAPNHSSAPFVRRVLNSEAP